MDEKMRQVFDYIASYQNIMLVFENFRDIYFREIGDGAGTPGGAREATKG